MLRWVLLSIFVAAFAGVTPRAAAQDSNLSSEEEQARALFEAGRTAYDAGRFEHALRYFRESYDLSHRPALLFNIGSAADRLQQNEEALEAYRAYLEAVPNATNREFVQSRIDFLQERVGQGGAPSPAGTTTVSTSSGGRDAGSGDVTGEWWFWTLIAVLVVGAGVGITAGVIAATSGVEAPLPGDVPVFMALRVPMGDL